MQKYLKKKGSKTKQKGGAVLTEVGGADLHSLLLRAHRQNVDSEIFNSFSKCTRDSRVSRVQIAEVLRRWHRFFPKVGAIVCPFQWAGTPSS